MPHIAKPFPQVMKAILSTLLCLLLLYKSGAQDPAYPTVATVQNITRSEYFFDTDPGFGLGTPISITPGVDLTVVGATTNTAGLTNGMHRLFIRTQGADGKWSLSAANDFLVDYNPPYPTVSPVQTITEAEYVLDNNTAFGAGISIAITPATDLVNVPVAVNTAGLLSGVHRVYLRTRSANGWSLTAQREFLMDENPAYPAAPAAPGNIVYAEYFFNTDPGFGAGTPVAITPAADLQNISIAVNTGVLPDGTHRFYLRTLSNWSLTGYQTFVKGTPLPLRWLSFFANNTEHRVTLDWKTTSEINTAQFAVERSANGVRFDTIGSVQAANATGTQAYRFNDDQPLAGKAFYRLKLVDRDGKFDYSATVPVNRGKVVAIDLFPNPAGNVLTVMLPAHPATQTLAVVDAGGKVVKLLAPGAAGSVQVPLQELAPGQYFIRWQGGGEARVKPFVKR